MDTPETVSIEPFVEEEYRNVKHPGGRGQHLRLPETLGEEIIQAEDCDNFNAVEAVYADEKTGCEE
jgi:hypothetical protein